MTGEEREVRRAVEDARAQPHGFVFAPPGASPALVEALRALAAETGREFLLSEVKSPHDDYVQRHLHRDRPRVKASDDRAFLDNLKAIARGEIDVS